MEYLTIPVIKLNGPGLFPGFSTTIVLRNTIQVQEIVRCVRKKENQLGIFFTKNRQDKINQILPYNTPVYPFGVLTNIIKIVGSDKEAYVQIQLSVLERIELLADPSGLYGNVHIFELENRLDDDQDKEAAFKEILGESLAEYIRLTSELEGKPFELKNGDEPFNHIYPLSILLGQIMGIMEYSPEDTHAFLSTDGLEGRYYICMEKLKNAIRVKKVKKDIAVKVRENISERQKNAILNEELNVIKKKLNDGEDPVEEYKKKLEALVAPEEVKEKLNKELSRLERMPFASAESSVQMNYIDNMLDYPWSKASEDNNSLEYARQVLDEDHYGLEKVKERILEYLAVRSIAQNSGGTIMCLAGPPGTGKTSVVKSIARALGRKYVRISLGGVHDESEIRGHRKTYIGSMPGRIVAAMKSAKVCNPVILLDELDKMGADGVHGSPADAMLEVLDAEQNKSFRDHYMEVPIDLSNVIFVATANDKNKIPYALYDRLDIIDVESYTANEKVHIADKYLIGKQMEKNGLTSDNLMLCENVIESIIENYTREAGVRELERKLGMICRKVALGLVEKNIESVKLTTDNLEEYLGKPYNKSEYENHESYVGVTHGLAWTSVGGVVLDVEAALMPGKGELMLTGKMGDVMKESARIALSLVRSRSTELGLADDYYDTHSFHIHIPEGAVPKDGPSAGITLSTVLYSAVSNRKVRGDYAMTGEVTLTGRVLPIGGLRDKLLAANMAGFDNAIVPVANTRDVAELSDEIIGGMNIHYASCIDDVWNLVMEEPGL